MTKSRGPKQSRERTKGKETRECELDEKEGRETKERGQIENRGMGKRSKNVPPHIFGYRYAMTTRCTF